MLCSGLQAVIQNPSQQVNMWYFTEMFHENVIYPGIIDLLFLLPLISFSSSFFTFTFRKNFLILLLPNIHKKGP